MSDPLPLSEVKAHLSELVDQVEQQQDRIVVTRNGRTAAVLISPDDLAGLEETLALLSDPELLARIKQGQKDASTGNVVSLEELKAELAGR